MFPLQNGFEAIENQRQSIGHRLDGLSEAARVWKAKPTDWSALQIVEHLVLGDETVGDLVWSRRQIEARGAKMRPRPTVFRLIVWSMRRNLRLPVPSPDFEPRGETDWFELRARWEKARLGLRAHLESPGYEAAARPYFHTVAGPLCAAQLLELALVHTAYHARQLERLTAHPPREGSR